MAARLLAALRLPALRLPAAALAGLFSRPADCDVRPLLPPRDEAALRDYLAADGALNLSDLSPALAGFAWPGRAFDEKKKKKKKEKKEKKIKPKVDKKGGGSKKKATS